MTNTERLIRIFDEAQARPPGVERERFLAEACRDDPELKEQVLSLLASDDEAGSSDFLTNTSFSSTGQVNEQLGDVIGRYKLLEKIGEGGCGVVYVAEQIQPVRRRVALKVIKLGMDTKQVVARFEAERQALAMMDHPNIAKVLDAGSTETGRPYFVMELVRGVRITEDREEVQLSTQDCLNLFIKVCQAIQHAHQKGVIHRDIKPSNILVTLHDGAPVPKVIDFGIAKATEGRLGDATVYTQFLHFIGTPAYMSPEQAEMTGLDIDTRSDIYSLGVLLYELLTGQTPFDGEKLLAAGINEMRRTIQETEPVLPSTRLRQTLGLTDGSPIPVGRGKAAAADEFKAGSRRVLRLKETIILLRGDLDWIVMKCLEKDRSRRYDTANGLAADLTRHLNNEPVAARPPSVIYRWQKAWRRHKFSFATAAIVAGALLVGTIVSIWQALEAGKQRRQAEYNLYVAQINLAGPAWEHDNIAQLRKILESTRAFPDRGFEWYYWQRQAHLNSATLRGHVKRIASAAFSPDGLFIATGSDDRTARVWDSASGQELFRLLGHTNDVNSVAYSPDGKLIATASRDRTVRVWDTTSHQEVICHSGHKAVINSVAFSSDSLLLVTGSDDGTVRVWEARSHRPPLIFGADTRILAAAFSPDGRSIVAGGADSSAQLWDVATREKCTLEGHTGPVSSVAYSADGRRIVTGSYDRSARVWDVATGEPALLQLNGRGPISTVDFSGHGQRIVTGSWDSTVSVWDADTGLKLHTIPAEMSVFSAAFSPDGERIVIADGGDEANVWASDGIREPLLLQGNIPSVLKTTRRQIHETGVTLAISPDNRHLITGAGWPYDELGAVADGGTNQVAQVWDMVTGQKLFSLAGHTSEISCVAYSPDGRWIVTSSGDQTARVWDAGSGQPVGLLNGFSKGVNAVAFSPDSQRIVAGGQDGLGTVWDVATSHTLFPLVGHSNAIRSAAYSRDGNWIATGSWDCSVRLWNTATGTGARLLKSPNLLHVQAVAFSPDSERIAASGWPRLAVVWNVATGTKVCELQGHSSPVSAIAFSQDGRRVVTASYDHTVKVWDANTGRELTTLDCNGEELSAMAFSNDGHRIVTGDRNQTIRIWESARPDQVAIWQAEERAAASSKERWRKELAAQLRDLGSNHNR